MSKAAEEIVGAMRAKLVDQQKAEIKRRNAQALAKQEEVDRLWRSKLEADAARRQAVEEGIVYGSGFAEKVALGYDPYSRRRMGDD